jgi:hypothetical protein
MDDLKFLWATVWDPERNVKRQLDFFGALKLYYTLAFFAFVAYAVIGSIAVALGTYAGAIAAPSFPAGVVESFVSSVSYFYIIAGGIGFFFIALPLGLAIDALLYQIVARFFLNIWKGSYDKTFAAAIMGSFPILLLYWLTPVPFLNGIFIIIAPIWSLIVLVIALSVQQKVKRLEAILALLLVEFLSVLVLLLVGLSLVSAIAYVVGGVTNQGVMSFPWQSISSLVHGLVTNSTNTTVVP